MSAKRTKAIAVGQKVRDQRLVLIGKIIKAARENLVVAGTDELVNQAEFYKKCRDLENPKRKTRKGVAFRSTDDSGTNQRRFMSEVEKGYRALTSNQQRIIESVFGWPAGALAEPFTDQASFDESCSRLAMLNLDTQVDTSAGTGGEAADTEAVVGASEASNSPTPKRHPATEKLSQPAGIQTLATRRKPLPSRAALAEEIQDGLVPTKQEDFRIVVVQGEAGVGKSQLLAEWWRDFGRKRFRRNTFTLDCSRLGGDQILQELNSYFLSRPTSVLTSDLVAAINRLKTVLIVLDQLSHEDDIGGGGTSGRADSVALRRVRETVSFLAANGVRASLLLLIQTAEDTEDALQIANKLNAKTSLLLVRASRLSAEEGAQMVKELGVKNLSQTDLVFLTEKMEGLPISLAAAAHYLRAASASDAEAFLVEIGHRNIKYFEQFFGRYLSALNTGPFDKNAHPHAYLRLLALMPGGVTKVRVDNLLAERKIVRLENGSTDAFSRMRIDFVVDGGETIDINPMVRGLLRQEIKNEARQGGSDTITREELHWIHASAAKWCIDLLPDDPTKVSTVEIELVEGTLYHLLELRDYLPGQRDSDWRSRSYSDTAGLFDERASAEAITQYCLEIVRRFLIDPSLRTTRFLGQYETKARLLSLFFESFEGKGHPKNMSVSNRALIYTEMGVCWMHAGRLQLAHDALANAANCFLELPVREMCEKPLAALTSDDASLWRTWSNFASTVALVLMRMGRPRELVVESRIASAVKFAERLAREALESGPGMDATRAAVLRSTRRVLCRKGNVALNGGDREIAGEAYRTAAELDARVDGRKLTGDALRRQIEVLVLQGPCFPEDIAQAEALLEPHLDLKQANAMRRLSNDIIAMFTTKIMLLRAKGDFNAAEELIGKIERHEFILRGECPFTAQMEFELEKYKLMIVRGDVSPSAQRDLRLIAEELLARHHFMLHWDVMLLIAHSEPEPEKTEILDYVERSSMEAGWFRRSDAIARMRMPEGNAVQAFGC